MANCNIIIPTYDRPDYLKRLLGYYNDCKVAYHIIVADSSSDENKERNKKTIKCFTNLNILYLDEYPLSEYPLNLGANPKISNALGYVTSDYCVICADDDFVTPNGISQSVDFLENNSDFTIAHGRYIRFWPKNGEDNKRQFSWRSEYRFQSITSPAPTARLTNHLSNYSQTTFYTVHRADFMRMIFEETIRFTDDVRFAELLPSMLALIYGKMKCLDVLYAARETILTSGSATSATLSDFIRAGNYEAKYKRFRECLSTHLSQQSQLDIEESKKVVDNAMSAFIMRKVNLNANGGNIITRRMRGLLDFLNLPDWLDKRLRRSYKIFTRPEHLRKHSTDMSPSSKYYDDFDRIRLHILSRSKINPK